MPSSITLTVKHLPTSTSFFLSALQPLHYRYVGRSDNTIGFGPEGGRADFWITQEIPGVPAGAAHVAFPAASRKDVEYFFTAALKAGGQIHGEPAVRDDNGYYSAAVIDFDGNSIEAVYRPNIDQWDRVSIVSSHRSRLPPPTEVSGLTARTSATRRKSSGDIVDGVLAEARNAAGTARQLLDNCRPNLMPQSNGSSDGKAIMTALLGVAAGAALTYVVTRDDKGSQSSDRRPSTTERSYTEPARPHYLALEGPRSTYSGANSKPRSYYSASPKSPTLEEIEYASAAPSTRSRRSRRHSDVGSVSSSKASRAIKMIEYPPAPIAVTELSTTSKRSGTSHRSSKAESVLTVRQLNRTSTYPPPAPSSKYSKHSKHTPPTTVSKSSSRRDPLDYALGASRAGSPYTSATSRREPKDYALPASRATSSVTSASRREAKDYPLPPSRATSYIGTAATEPLSHIGSKRGSKAGSKHSKMDMPVTPDDSISQVSSVRSDRTIRASDRRSIR